MSDKEPHKFSEKDLRMTESFAGPEKKQKTSEAAGAKILKFPLPKPALEAAPPSIEKPQPKLESSEPTPEHDPTERQNIIDLAERRLAHVTAEVAAEPENPAPQATETYLRALKTANQTEVTPPEVVADQVIQATPEVVVRQGEQSELPAEEAARETASDEPNELAKKTNKSPFTPPKLRVVPGLAVEPPISPAETPEMPNPSLVAHETPAHLQAVEDLPISEASEPEPDVLQNMEEPKADEEETLPATAENTELPRSPFEVSEPDDAPNTAPAAQTAPTNTPTLAAPGIPFGGGGGDGPLGPNSSPLNPNIASLMPNALRPGQEALRVPRPARKGGDFLVKLLIFGGGYFLGKGVGRRETESKHRHESRQKDRTIQGLEQQVAIGEKRVRQATVQAAESVPRPMPGSELVPPMATEAIPVLPTPAEAPATRFRPSEALKQPPIALRPLETFERPMTPPTDRVEIPQPPRPEARELKESTDTLRVPELLAEAKHVRVNGQTAEQLYHANRIDQEGLRRVVAEQRRGGTPEAVLATEMRRTEARHAQSAEFIKPTSPAANTSAGPSGGGAHPAPAPSLPPPSLPAVSPIPPSADLHSVAPSSSPSRPKSAQTATVTTAIIVGLAIAIAAGLLLL